MTHLTMPDWLPGETGPPESRRGKPNRESAVCIDKREAQNYNESKRSEVTHSKEELNQ